MNVVIIGTGETLSEHNKSWETIKGANVVGIMGAGKDGDKSGVTPLMHSLNLDDLKQQDVDMVDICVPFEERAYWIRKMAEMNMNIVCTNPFGKNPDDVMSIVGTCQENSVSFYPDNVFQNRPAYANALSQIRKGAIGKPGVLRFAVQEPHPDVAMDIFTGLGGSLFAWLHEAFGAVWRVSAKHIQKVTKDGLPLEYGVATLRLADGAIVHVELTWAGVKKSSSFELSGDEGMLRYDSGDNAPIQMDNFSDMGIIPASDTVLNETILKRQLEHTVTCATSENAKSLIDHYTYAMELVQAVNESVFKGEPVTMKGDVIT